MKLSEGAIPLIAIMGGDYPEEAVLQVLNICIMEDSNGVPHFRLTMSDGRHALSYFLLRLQKPAEGNILKPNCICLLQKSGTLRFKDGRQWVVILKMEVIKTAEEVAGKIGDPYNFVKGNGKVGPQSAPAPSVRPLQPQNGNDGDSPRALDITRSTAEMTVKDLQPLSVVEDEGFRNFVKLLDPRYKIPSRKSLMKGTIAEMHEECRSKVRKSLDGADSVVLTTGVWTSRDKGAYLPVSCHVIDENWQTQAYVLEISSFAGQRSTDICSELNRIADEWGITDKVAAVVTDNGANMVAAGWEHYSCFAHALILVVRHSIKALPDLLHIKQRCSAIVHFFHHSRIAAERLKEVQKELKRPEHKLIQSVETRWNSVFYMLESLCEQKEAVATVLGLLGKSSLCLSEEDWSTISLSVDALRPFEEVTREIVTEKHGSVSNVIPLVSLLLRATASHECKGSKLAAELSVQCQRRFKGVETLHCLAASTFLDPRFKSLGFSNIANVGPLKGRLMAEMQLVGQTSTTSVSAPATAPVTTPSFPAGATASPPAAKAGIWEEFDTRVLASQQHRKAGTNVLIEMRRFSEEKVIPRDQDPLLWWKNNEKMFPCLSKLAKKYLVISCSCVICTCRKDFL